MLDNSRVWPSIVDGGGDVGVSPNGLLGTSPIGIVHRAP